ncbi:MAG TPA: PfkB family carbohydrate kinase, partial [Bacillota bacterium]|nr:PfkB family carbohydrate kinase [Bacillota bacterium]
LGSKADELDPSGAGDTFCGAVLAELAKGAHPVMAARKAVVLAARMIECVGPAELLKNEPQPQADCDSRVIPDENQIDRTAHYFSTLKTVAPHDFIQPDMPFAGHTKMLDFVFATTLQQFSFWETDGTRYAYPLLAKLGGIQSKGSEYLWRAYLRYLDTNPELFTAGYQARISAEELGSIYQADDGSNPMPAFELHLAKSHDYGRDMEVLGLTPHTIIEKANTSEYPMRTLLEVLDCIGGYKEDPLRKKSNLVLEILKNRPERFLHVGEGEALAPIVDYHNMRACLRIGLIKIADPGLEKAVIERRLIGVEDEWAIRYAAYRAIDRAAVISGKGVEGVSQFFFNSRKYCPETSEPRCSDCIVNQVCIKRRELFQPVFRTTFY